jgi:serine protease
MPHCTRPALSPATDGSARAAPAGYDRGMKPRKKALVGALFSLFAALAEAAEWNPLPRAAVSPGAESHRIIVGFRATAGNTRPLVLAGRHGRPGATVTRTETSGADVTALAARQGIALQGSRQISGAMHVLFLPETLYGVHLESLLDTLRSDPAVEFAAIDERRQPLGVPLPNDPLFGPTAGVASGQWYLLAPNPAATVEGVATADLAATDAVDAWSLTTGSAGIVIADVDTGVLFNHPDLLRANLGGRLLPGYDFVGEDYKVSNGQPLGTYLAANDGDGWDPDPSDPGDWISSSDVQNPLFPTSTCGDPSQDGGLIPSSWHGTRVVGIFGAITDNEAGIAGLTWGNAAAPGPWILPVRALGKCGGYDSDIIAGMEWAVGLTVTPPNAADSSTGNVPPNPFPADIVNLSLGGSTSCSSAYLAALTDVTRTGALVVASAGNGGQPGLLAPVEAPANCSAQVGGVIAVAGLRNVGTKVGYSSFGAEVGVGAPAGNCLNASGNCLRSIDTTTNSGTKAPSLSGNTYTSEANPNLGTSFSAPIVSGIAALMRTVNANLTPAQLVARLKASAVPFPANSGALPVCPATDPATGECACPQAAAGVTTQCGTGMVNALQAVTAALAPVGVVATPSAPFSGSVVFDASGSLASCGNTIASFAWTATPSTLIAAGAASARVTLNPASLAAGTSGTLVLMVTDAAGHADTETLIVGPSSLLSSTAAAASGSAASACPAALAVNPAAPAPPTVSGAFSPASVAPNAPATLTLTLANTNPYALTGTALSVALPGGLTLPTGARATTTCGGVAATASASAGALSLSGAIIPAAGSCSLQVALQSAATGSYSLAVPAGALSTGPAGSNDAAAAASLTVAASGGGGGGGALQGAEIVVGAAGLVLLWRRRRQARGRA